jgi:hypothetical protein
MRICKVKNCGLKHLANGFCEKHNRQNERTGDPEFRKVKPTTCKICGKPRSKKTSCVLCDDCYHESNRARYRRKFITDHDSILTYYRGYRLKNKEKINEKSRLNYPRRKEYYREYYLKKKKLKEKSFTKT